MLIKKIILSIFILFSSIFYVLAQNEGNIWYFGINAGLDFNSGAPVALTDGMLNTTEGCASICDNSGNLLFYTDGMTVYNKNHTIMPNGSGLLGNMSSTQSAIIVKQPGSSTMYYLFTADGMSGSGGGLNYSEIDMTLDGGLGDVNANKNINLFPFACEKVTAVIHQNGFDFWIIGRLESSNTYHAYLLSLTGINMVPVITNIGLSYGFSLGYLKGSPTGDKIAAASIYGGNDGVDIFDFDNSNGTLSNAIHLSNTFSSNTPYGIEFSPDGNILYVSQVDVGASIAQYNLLAGSALAIDASKVLISSNTLDIGGALQLGPDNKIYFAEYMNNTLGVINDPNVLGMGCNFSGSSINLSSGMSALGLPTFFSSIFTPPPSPHFNDFTFNNSCLGDFSFFTITDQLVDSVLWNFGDTNSGLSNTSTDLNPSHIFSDVGTYQVTLYSYLQGMGDTIVYDVTVTIPIVDLGNDTTLCAGKIISLDASMQNATYLWQDNSINSTYTVSTEGDYFVEVTVNGCTNSDTVHIGYYTLPTAVISGYDSICFGDQVFIEVNLTGSSPFEISYTNGVDTNILSGDDLILIQTGEAGLYSITNVSDYYGCIGSYSGLSEVIVNACSLTVHIPNTFTPNSDGSNEGFIPIIYDIDDVLTFNMQIFNRWGELMYETNDEQKSWDGQFNAAFVPQGIYVYLITITDIYDKEYHFKGDLSLIR